jgi:rubrerythrin
VEEKYTFSSLISLIINIESQEAQFYREMAGRLENRELSIFLLSLSENCMRNAELIDKRRRETVVEMALEPISGLNIGSYMEKINSIISSGEMGDIDKAIELSRIIEDLYAKASSRIASISPDTSELLSRISRRKSGERRRLEEFKHAAPPHRSGNLTYPT